MEELNSYKDMSIEDIDINVPNIEELKENKHLNPISTYFLRVGDILVKCSFKRNGRSLEDCFLSYLEKKAMLLD